MTLHRCLDCPTPCERGKSRCDVHERAERRANDAPRLSASTRGYDAKWRRYAASFLRRHPLCVRHEERGRVVAAKVVDHIVPHRGDPALFWDATNHQALCVRCHNAKTAREDVERDRGGRIAGRAKG